MDIAAVGHVVGGFSQEKYFLTFSQRAFTSGRAKSSENFGLADPKESRGFIIIDNLFPSLAFRGKFFFDIIGYQTNRFQSWIVVFINHNPIFILQDQGNGGQVHAINTQFIHQVHIWIERIDSNVFELEVSNNDFGYVTYNAF
jgi:hypothetical protein